MERLSTGGTSFAAPWRARFQRAFEQAGWELRRAVRAFSRRLGLAGWLLLGCGVAAAAALAVAQRQAGVIAALDARLADATARRGASALSAKPAPVATAGRAAAQGNLDAFDRILLPHDDIPLVVEDILRLADESGLSIKRGDYRPQADVAGAFLRYRMTLPVKGAAPAIHRFLQASLRAQKTLALESVQFKRDRIDSPEVEARVQWAIFTRLPAGAVLPSTPLESDIGAPR